MTSCHCYAIAIAIENAIENCYAIAMPLKI